MTRHRRRVNNEIFTDYYSTSRSFLCYNGEQEVNIYSNPTSALVTIKSVQGVIAYEGKSPVTTKLSRKFAYEVIIKLEGYKDATARINKNLSLIYLGNIICGGLIGLIIDPITGAMWKLEPDEINITLAVAYNKRSGEKEVYATFRYLDEENRLRTVYIPMIKS